MLGHVVTRALQDEGIEVITSQNRFIGGSRDSLIEEVRNSGAGWVINALGRIKQKCSEPAELLNANALFPLQLRTRLRPQQRLLHASTDCVFSGRDGNYLANHERDAIDDYGFSKILGETAVAEGGGTVFRVSIIGPELGNGSGLLGWFLRQKGAVQGYTNHLWNGITTLEWAKHAVALVQERWKPDRPVIQFASEPSVSKRELLDIFASVWNIPVTINPVAAPDMIDRTLSGDVICPPILAQLQQLAAWHNCRFPSS